MSSLAAFAHSKSLGSVLRLGGGALLAASVVAALMVATGLEAGARAALAVFIVTLCFWVCTRVEPALVAVCGVAGLGILQVLTPADIARAAASDVIWLLAAMFIVGAALERTGLAARLRDRALIGVRTTQGLFWRMSLFLGLMTFVLPSTSARAALALPAIDATFPDCTDPRRRAFALVIPSIVLVTTSAALTGAASHLLANDLLYAETGVRISYLQWALWGAPFALVIGVITNFVIMRAFLSKGHRVAPLQVAPRETEAALSNEERRVLGIIALLAAAWASTGWHGLAMPHSALAAALLLIAPKIGVVPLRELKEAVQWRFLVFAAGAVLIGAALIGSGAANWASDWAWRSLGMQGSALAAIIAIVVISMASHLLVTSHLARAAMLILPVLAAAKAGGVDAAGAVFLAMAGANFCLTFAVSSKVLILFTQPRFGVAGADVAKVSALIAPIYFMLLVSWACLLLL